MNLRRHLPLFVLAALAAMFASHRTDARTKPLAPSGLDLAGMDRAVAPGDDFFAYANGTWLKTTEIPADRSSWGIGAVLVELTAKRTADLIAESAKSSAPAGSDARKIGDYYASFMDEASIEAKRAGAAPAEARRHRRHRPTRAGLARARRDAARRRRRAQQHQARHRQPVRPVGRAGPRRSRDATRRSCCRAASACPTATTTSIRRRAWPTSASSTRRTSPRCSSSPASRTRDAKAARIFELERRIAGKRTPRASTPRTSRRATTTGRGATSRRARPASTGRPSSPPPGSTSRSASSSGSRPPSAASPRWCATSRSRPGRTISLFHAIEHVAQLLPKAFVDEDFAFYGKVLNGTPQQRERWKRAVDATDDALGEAVGKLYVARYFPPAEKARAEEMVRNLVAAFGRRIDALGLDGAGDQGAGQGQARRAQGRRRLSRQVARLLRARGRARRRARQRRARGAVRVPAQPRQARPAGRSRRVGDEPAAGQRGEPAGDERAELPGRDPAAAVLRSGARRGRWTTARSARSSATRSATASTTRARSSTPTAGCATGGPRKTSRTSRRRRRSWSSSSTPTTVPRSRTSTAS